jgi:signal transduction histidine kinase
MKKWQLWILSILLLLLTCAYFFNYFYSIERTRKIEEIAEHQRIHAKQAAKSFHELFGKWNSVLFYLSNDNNVILMNQRGKYDLTRLSIFLKDEIKGITRTDKDGRIIFTVPLYPNSIGANISKQKHMIKILSDHKPVVSQLFNTVQGYQAIVIHYPVFKENEFDGTIAVILNFEKIAKDILDDIKIGKSGYAWMLSSEGIELYCPVQGHIGKSINETSSGYPELINLAHIMLSGKAGSAVYTYNKVADKTETVKKIVHYMPIHLDGTFWSLAITNSENEITASLSNFRKRLIIIFVIIFIGGLGFSYYGFKAWVIVKESSLRKTAEEALIKERTLLRTLIDNLPSGVFIKNNVYQKIISNPIHTESIRCHLRNLGVNSDIDILGKTDFEVFPKELAEHFFIDDQKVINNGTTILNQEELGISPEGNQIWLLVSKVPIRDPNGKILGMVAITTDITKRKQSEEELLLAKEKAEESDRLKTAFLNNISHEIRTPLNAIIGFTGLLNNPGLTSDKLKYYTEIITESSHQLLMIITDIINIATIEAGLVNVKESVVNINSIFPILTEQYKAIASAKKIELTFTAPLPDNQVTIYTDYIKLIEIISNLINNALKFTDHGFVTYGYELKNELLEFHIKDSGLGIKPEFMDRIFDRFFRAEDIISTHKGTGLGLSISKAYIEVLGGKIWVNSVPDEGSTFYFTIPYRKAVESKE